MHIQHPPQPLDQHLDAGRIEHIGVVFDAQTQFGAGHGLHRQRIVVVFAAAKSVMASPSAPDSAPLSIGIVLVDEEGVEQLVVTGDAVDLVERQVLVLQGVAVSALQLVEQLGDGGRRR